MISIASCTLFLLLISHVSFSHRFSLRYSWSFQYLLPDLSPTKAPPQSRCAANETFRRMGRPCGNSCGTFGQQCARRLMNWCQCRVGYARNRTGTCIYHKHCPKNLQDAEFLDFV